MRFNSISLVFYFGFYVWAKLQYEQACSLFYSTTVYMCHDRESLSSVLLSPRP